MGENIVEKFDNHGKNIERDIFITKKSCRVPECDGRLVQHVSKKKAKPHQTHKTGADYIIVRSNPYCEKCKVTYDKAIFREDRV